MPNHITHSNIILLTPKLLEEAEDLDQNVPVFPETLKRAHQCMYGNKDK